MPTWADISDDVNPNWSLLQDVARPALDAVDFQVLISTRHPFLVLNDRPVIITHFIKNP